MNKREIVIGIDTSNYTTSVALVTTDGELIANIKRPLPVKLGECGLRQSDAVFAHVKNLPECMKEAREYLAGDSPVAVGVSERPRNLDGSYMPCFLSGVAAAESISATLGAPLYRFSHQCGHVMAALYSASKLDWVGQDFCAFHVSGGTTDMLLVSAADRGFAATRIGGTDDLNAGQAIDRIGVMMGLPFPAGPKIEELAGSFLGSFTSKKPKIKDMKISLSGLENLAKTLYSKTGDKTLTSAFTLDYIASGLIMLADAYTEKYGKEKLIFSGGVMSNKIIKEKILKKYDAAFAQPSLSCDNAVGIAVLAAREYIKK